CCQVSSNAASSARPDTLSLHDALPIFVGAGLVGDAIRAHAAAHQLRQHLGGVAQQRDRLRLAGGGVFRDAGQGVVQVGGLLVHRSEEHTSELQSRENLVCRLLLEKKKK